MEAQRTARQEALRAEEVANAQRLPETQARQEQEELATQGADRERRDTKRTPSGAPY